MKKLFTTAFLFIGCILFAHAQQFDVDTIVYNGPSDKHINFVFLGDGYQVGELDKYIEDVKNTAEGILNKPPFKENHDFFNVFAIKVPSNESGASHPGKAYDEAGSNHPVIKVNNYFGSTFDYGGIHRLLVPTNSMAISSVLASNFPEYDHVFMLVNSSYYGGSGGSFATSSTHSSSKEIAIHELGHSFARLADEYWAGQQYAAERANMTQVSSPDNVKWKKWLNNTGVGIYPHEESPSWFRPHQRCNMRYLSSDYEVIHFCMVCNDAITQTIVSLVSQSDVPETPGVISGPAQLCAQQEAIVYSIEKVTGAGSYTWTVPTGFTIIAGQGTNAITVKAGQQSGRISVKAQNFNGYSAASNLDIQVQAMPAVVAGNNESVCVDKESYTLTGFSPAGGTWAGKGITADGFFNPATAGTGNHTLIYTYQQNGCSVTASKRITVQPKPVVSIEAFGQVCSSSENYLLAGGKPAGGTFSGEHVSNGVFNAAAAGPGLHTISYTYHTTAGCSNTITQEITVSVCTGVNEAEVATGISLFPNPTSSTVQLEANLVGSSEAILQLFDRTGRLVFSQKAEAQSGKLNQQLDLSNYNKGIYLLKIITEKGHINRKVVVQ